MWFPTSDFQLDIVGFLAILGEGSVEVNYQVSTLSWLIFLPRLLPAPQAFLRPSRPTQLETAQAIVIGTRSGSVSLALNQIPRLLLSDSPNYAVRYIKLDAVSVGDNAVRPRLIGPLPFLSVLGCCGSIAILVLSILENDGWALLATVLLSALSSVIGLCSKWSLKFAIRTATRYVPPSDIVVVYPNGAFDVIQCTESVSRALFFAPATCHYYLDTKTFRRVALVGTLMVMLGIISLGNATTRLQVAIGIAYIVLNVGYWMVASLPEESHWNLEAFKLNVVVDEQGVKNFTGALWHAIALTGSIDWVRLGPIAPATKAWDEWLNEAKDQIVKSEGQPPHHSNGSRNIPPWDCQKALTDAIARNTQA